MSIIQFSIFLICISLNIPWLYLVLILILGSDHSCLKRGFIHYHIIYLIISFFYKINLDYFPVRLLSCSIPFQTMLWEFIFSFGQNSIDIYHMFLIVFWYFICLFTEDTHINKAEKYTHIHLCCTFNVSGSGWFPSFLWPLAQALIQTNTHTSSGILSLLWYH